ncbi:MAG: sulfotransferase family 2 domain-containing protein [Bacillota bacterium]
MKFDPEKIKEDKLKLLIFMHISKTGGTTMNSIIQRQYHPSETKFKFFNTSLFEEYIRTTPAKQLAKLKCTGGHVEFRRIPIERPYTYFTMLRDPVDRVISLYYYIKTPKDLNHLYNKTKDMSLEDFIESKDAKLLLRTSNEQTRFVSGQIDGLEKAKENLLTEFIAFGLTERFDESLLLMSRKLGWRNMKYDKKNVTKSRPRKKEIPIDLIKKIEKYNQLDLELYHYAKSLFEKQLKEL